MPTLDAEAVVLRQYTLSEADRIVVLFSRENGKLRAVAKGAKKPRSHLGGCLEPLNQVHLSYSLKEGAELGRVLRCEIVHSYLGKIHSLINVFVYNYFSEIVNEIVEYYNPNIPLYRLLIACMKSGERSGANQALVRYFEVWSLKLSGLLPNYGSCSVCGRCVKDDGFYARPEAGDGRCQGCAAGNGIHIRPAAAVALTRILELPPDTFASMPMTEATCRELENLTQKHFEWHLEKRLKSYPGLKDAFRNG